MFLHEDEIMTKHCLSFTNRWSDRMTESNAETLFKSVLFQKAKWLSYAFIHNWVHVSLNEVRFVKL